MPWQVRYGAKGCPETSWSVVRDSDGSIAGCYGTRADAVTKQQELYAETQAADALVAADLPTGTQAASGGPSAGDNFPPPGSPPILSGQTGAMLAFIPAAPEAARFALDDGEPAETLHVTSIYLGEASQFDDVTRNEIISRANEAAARIQPFDARAFAPSVFNPYSDSPCLTYLLDGHELGAAQAAVREMAGQFESDEAHGVWIPHITLAYDEDPAGLMSTDVMDLCGPVHFDTLRVAFAGVNTDIALGAGINPELPAAPVDEAAIVAAMSVGSPWSGVIAVEGEWTGDGRMFAAGSLVWDGVLPIALKWQPAEADGHEGSVIVGRVDAITRTGNLIEASGVMDDGGENGAEALRLLKAEMAGWVSVCTDDISDTDIETVEVGPDGTVIPPAPPMPVMPPDAGPNAAPPEVPADMPEPIGDDGDPIEIIIPTSGIPDMPGEMPGAPATPQTSLRDIYHAGRIRSVTMVGESAFPEAKISVTPLPTEITQVVTAAAYTITIPELWPAEWFDEPAPEDMPEFGALRITASGRITGYLAPPGVVHRAFRASGQPVTVPTRQDYSEFNNKPALVATADGNVARINAGNITFNCGHPDPYDQRRNNPGWAREQYDNTCSIVARVRIGETASGVPWVAGALMHGIDADAVERMMGSALSGDWQGGRLNAALLVPVEGFPTRVQGSVRVTEGQIVASSVPVIFEPSARETIEKLAQRVGMDHASQFARLRDRVGSRS